MQNEETLVFQEPLESFPGSFIHQLCYSPLTENKTSVTPEYTPTTIISTFHRSLNHHTFQTQDFTNVQSQRLQNIQHIINCGLPLVI